MSQNAESTITYEEAVDPGMTAEQNVSSRVRIDRFLASVQNSGYRMAQLATSNSDDALDLEIALRRIAQIACCRPRR